MPGLCRAEGPCYTVEESEDRSQENRRKGARQSVQGRSVMDSHLEDRIGNARAKEAHISFELYRLLTNAISAGLIYQGSECQFKEVIPEFPIGEKRADLVIFASKYGKLKPFLVIEIKARVYQRPSRSMASAVKRALEYATGLDRTLTPFFAVYNGWELMVFKARPPYLIGAYGSIRDQYQARNLLLGLEEFSYTNKRELLSNLPKHPDRDSLLKRVLPSVAKELAKDPQEKEPLLRSWRQCVASD